MDISAKPCQYEITFALIAGFPSTVVSAMVLMKACIGITLPGICCWNCSSGETRCAKSGQWFMLTPSFMAAQLRIMQKSMAFQKVLMTAQCPRAGRWRVSRVAHRTWHIMRTLTRILGVEHLSFPGPLSRVRVMGGHGLFHLFFLVHVGKHSGCKKSHEGLVSVADSLP